MLGIYISSTIENVSHEVYIFSFIRVIFQKDCSILPSHQWYMRIPVIPYLQQSFVLSLLLIISILINGYYYFIVINCAVFQWLIMRGIFFHEYWPFVDFLCELFSNLLIRLFIFLLLNFKKFFLYPGNQDRICLQIFFPFY